MHWRPTKFNKNLSEEMFGSSNNEKVLFLHNLIKLLKQVEKKYTLRINKQDISVKVDTSGKM